MRFVRLMCAFSLLACSSNTPQNDGGVDASSSGDAGVADVVVTNGECIEAGAACQACCTTLHPDASGIFDNAIGNCACGANAPCASACSANFCQQLNSPKSCDQCISQKCYPNAKTACSADPSCKAWLDCLVPCP